MIVIHLIMFVLFPILIFIAGLIVGVSICDDD